LPHCKGKIKSEEDRDMNTDFPHVPWVPHEHDANREKIPPEEIDRFRGQYVAYSWEGDRVIAGALSEGELRQQLLAAGIDPQRVVFSYVDDL
jgi:hypothetical protein